MIPKTPFYQALAAGAAFTIVLAIAGGLLTRLTPWYHALRKPGWKPPDWAFRPIWTTVFAALTLSIAYAWDAGNEGQRQVMLVAIAINGVLNIAWSAIFFVMQNPAMAFAELVVFWISIAALILVMGSITPVSGLLLLPYIMWVSAAGVLNYQIVRLNRGR